MKLLFLDIETAPNSAFVWGLWNQNIGINQMIDSSEVLCWAAKFAGSKQVMYSGKDTDEHSVMIAQMHQLMDEADVICTYNGNKFDIPTLHKEFVLLGLPPPAPSKSLDLFKIVRKNFKFPSNKLDYVAQKLGIGGKVKHEGFELWIKCMAGDEAAWKKMQKYNKQDVVLLEKLYERILPWLSGHINRNLYADGGDACPTCGSHSLQRRGYSMVFSSSCRRLWFHSRRSCSNEPEQTSEASKEQHIDRLWGQPIDIQEEIHKDLDNQYAELIRKDLMEYINDPIVESIIHQMRKRSQDGIIKYGTTLYHNDLTELEWIEHAKQEAMDFILYLERLKFKLQGE